MKRMKLKNTYAYIVAMAMMLSFVTTSCVDDNFYEQRQSTVEEGLNATVNLKLKISDMPQMTRAIIDDARTNYCDNIWVGIYSTEGTCLHNYLYSTSGTNEAVNTKYDFDIKVTGSISGEVRIVAVANPSVVDALPSATSSETNTLDEILANADTWEKFKSICVKRSDPDDISQLIYRIPMSGYYSSTDSYNAATPDDIPTVTISEGSNTLSGTIILRKMISYNAFYITAGDNIDLEMKSWQVYNIPYYSYVMETSTNAGDDAIIARSTSTNTDDASTSTSLYNPSVKELKFESKSHPTKNDGKNYEFFEFYQFENKHTACDYSGNASDWVGIRENLTSATDMYNDREREYKNNGANTGIYKSLVNNTDNAASMANNNASYVVLIADLSYYYVPTKDENGNITNADNATPVASGTEGAIKRTAEVQYVIHLGYCEDKNGDSPTLATAEDFNCRRNSKYQYTVKINGVNNIVVEAKTDKENQPGAEGRVIDTTADYVELDSHYNVFNISFTNDERSKMGYRIEAPYGSTTYILDSKVDATKRTWESSSDDNYPFYSWIKFKPTTGKDVLAEYSPDGLWTLSDLRDVANHAGNNGSTDVANTDEQWYTVFIDEYVYHIGETYDETKGAYNETSWPNYTNKENRVVELYTTEALSKDLYSEYLSGKYAFSQKAIQTYYKGTSTALGIEHTNESYGLNFRWNGGYSGWSLENGRYNLKEACKASFVNLYWNKVVSQTEPEAIPYDYNDANGITIDHEKAEYPVSQLYNIKTGGVSVSNWNQDPSPHNMTDRYYYANTACMNRNRDLNGNGKIDDNEIRWFLPTYNQYVQVMIGMDGLVSPPFDWTDYSAERFNDSAHNYLGSTLGRSNMHFATSNGTYIFAEEGYSQGYKVFEINNWAYMAYDIRCVRYLGDNPGSALESDASEVTVPYSKTGNIISAPYYEDICKRSYVATYLPPHLVNSEYNKPYDAFEVSTARATSIKSTNNEINVNPTTGRLSINSNGNDTGSNPKYHRVATNYWYRSLLVNDICDTYYQNEDGSDLGKWRIPNIKEIAMMHTTGAFIDGDNYVPSCTHEYFINFPTNTGADECMYSFFGRKGANEIARSIFSSSGNFVQNAVRCVRDIKQ